MLQKCPFLIENNMLSQFMKLCIFRKYTSNIGIIIINNILIYIIIDIYYTIISK